MNAQDALKLTQENWSKNEDDYLKYVVGYHTKVENAAREGKTSCIVGTIPQSQPPLFDFVASFFEGQGYYVGFHGTPTGEASISLNWKQEPIGSRIYKESQEFNKCIV